jgi:threonine synthase
MMAENERQWKFPPYCQKCGKNYNDPHLWCPNCQNLIFIKPIKGPPKSQILWDSIWSFAPFLPSFSSQISLQEGATPIISLSNFPELQGLKVKLEFRNPTGSFRDRASALLVSDAKSIHKKHIIGASTGSFGISLSAYTVKGRLKATNFVPSNLELSKIEQMKIYGAKVVDTHGTLDSAINQAKILIKQQDAYFPNPNENLLTIEGQKTIGLELAFQLENIENIILPRGSGSLIISVYRGLLDAQASGWIEKIPHIYAVSLDPNSNVSLVESLEIKDPRLMHEVTRILKLTQGQEYSIDALEMLKDAIAFAKSEGLFIAPGSASVLSAVKQLKDDKNIDITNTVAILSGSGLNAMNIFATQLGRKKKVVWGLSETSTTRFKILNIIATQQANYAPAIANIFGKTPSLQAIYQNLALLEKDGLIVDQTPNKKRKSYILTKKGQDLLENLQNIIDLRNL